MSDYKIKEGDCLILIAQKFGVKVKDIANLNSDQIENVDLIFAGDTIKLPGNEAAPIPLKTGERIPLPDPPKTNACGDDLCGSSTPEFVDILYVPSHPETKDGEKRWYAVTDVAKEAIKKEMSLLAEAMVADNRDTSLQNLNNLGILSKFEAKPHEAFLTDDEGIRLRHLEWLISTINSGAAKLYEHGGQDGFIIRVAEQENLDYGKLLGRHVFWGQFKQFILDYHLGAIAVQYFLESTDLIEEISEKEKQAQLMERARLSVFHGVVDHLSENIEELKEKAIKNAKTVTSKDGTKFIWDKERRYFTSEKQKTVTDRIKLIVKHRPKTDVELALTPHEEALAKLNKFWHENVHDSNAALKQLAKGNAEPIPPEATYAITFTNALRELNRHGYVIKEQCLTFDELEGSLLIHQGPEALSGSDSAFGKWRENDNLMFGVKAAALDEKGLKEEAELRKEILLELRMYTTDGEIDQDSIQRASDNIAWAYYPTIALLRVIDVTLEKHMSALGSILNGNQTVPGIFNELITIKKIAINRINKLKKVAEKRAISGDIKNILLLDNMPKSLHLIWDEKQYAPTEMKRGIFKNDAGAADLQAVECSLLSDGEVKWIRGPSWLIPKSSANKSHLGHVKDITESVTLADPTVSKDSPGTTLKDALKDIGKGLIAAPDAKNDFVTKPLNLSAQVKDFDKAFWEDSYHWQDGIGPKGKSSAYIANAQAQFLRLTVSRTGDLNLPGSEINGLSTNMSLTGDTSAEVKLTLLSGEMSFATYLPKMEGYHLEIAYVAQADKSKKPESKMYNAGHFRLKLSTKIYGVAGASCMLSGNLAFGPSETQPGHIGVKGRAFKAPDYNAHVEGGHTIRTRDMNTSTIPQGVSAQAGAS
ncbi:LysM peptidoglycan-binding domain-containing protein, partial [Enterovibrio sp. ZSDZ42]